MRWLGMAAVALLATGLVFELGRMTGNREAYDNVGRWWGTPTASRDSHGQPCDFWTPTYTYPKLFHAVSLDRNGDQPSRFYPAAIGVASHHVYEAD